MSQPMQGLTKKYYGIAEVAKMFGMEISKIRFWEEKFPTLKLQRNKAGDRIFTHKDIEHLELIYDLVENRRFTLEGARNYIKNREHKLNHNTDLIDSLLELRKFLVDLRGRLDARTASGGPPPLLPPGADDFGGDDDEDDENE
jgi:DNA-binding transcriptional MerR regulator